MAKHKTIETTYEEWLARGRQLFGKDMKLWRFVCPSCGHIQTANDFLEAGVKGEEIGKYLGFSCIGRFDGHSHVEMCSGEGPCNYTSGGLFNLAPVRVKIDNQKTRSVFAFDESNINSREICECSREFDEDDGATCPECGCWVCPLCQDSIAETQDKNLEGGKCITCQGEE